jgi:hypothetical protein
MLPASAATAAVEVTAIHYVSPGRDNRSNVSLNGEYAAITNTGSAEADLDRWTLRDAAGHVFTFPRYLLQPGGTVYVHTGRGSNGRPHSGHLYWRSGSSTPPTLPPDYARFISEVFGLPATPEQLDPIETALKSREAIRQQLFDGHTLQPPAG